MVQSLERKQADLTMAAVSSSSKSKRSRMPEPRRRDSPYPSQTAINAATDAHRIKQAKKAYQIAAASNSSGQQGSASPLRPRDLALPGSSRTPSSSIPQPSPYHHHLQQQHQQQHHATSSSSASSAFNNYQLQQQQQQQHLHRLHQQQQQLQRSSPSVSYGSPRGSTARHARDAGVAGAPGSPYDVVTGHPGAAAATSPAASFFVKAAQKLNMSAARRKKKHHHHHQQPLPPCFPTNFMDVLRYNTPPVPPALLRRPAQGTMMGSMGGAGQQQSAQGGSKIKVMLRVCPTDSASSSSSSSFLKVDERRRQVTVYDPSAGVTSLRRPMPPKMFALDQIFDQDDSLSELCSQSLVDIIQSVVNGADGCLFCYGHARLGKTYTMIGIDDCPQNLGIIPCAIAWLFRLIQEQKATTQARFSVRVSAVEVTGQQERLKDLLADDAVNANPEGNSPAPGVYLRDDPICGMQLENQSELRAPTAERAAYYLDAAVAARTVPEAEEDARSSHMLFTLHIYQYRVDSSDPHQPTVGVAGGRSRLHLLDLGSCSKSSAANKDGSTGQATSGALSLGALGTVILALLNGQRHVPYRHSKLSQLIRDSLASSPSCRTCMIAHVSPAPHAYQETLQVIQLAAKIHRSRPRQTVGGSRAHSKFSGTSSDDSSCDEARLRRFRRGIRMGTLREGFLSDPSSSELSCDTVIYVGPHGQALSDRELTDNEGPPVRGYLAAPKMGMMRSGIMSDESPKMSSTGSQTMDRGAHQRGGGSGNRMVQQQQTRSVPNTPSRSMAGVPRHTPPYAQQSQQSQQYNTTEGGVSGQKSLTPQPSPQLRHATMGGGGATSQSLPNTPIRQPRQLSGKVVPPNTSQACHSRHTSAPSPQTQRCSSQSSLQYRSSSASPHPQRASPLASPQPSHAIITTSSASSSPSRRIPQQQAMTAAAVHSNKSPRHHHHHHHKPPPPQSPLARHSSTSSSSSRPSPSMSQTRQIPMLRQQPQTPPPPPPRKLHVSKAAAAAAAAEIAAATVEGCEQWVDGPAAQNWVTDAPAQPPMNQTPPVKAFVRDWVEKHSTPEESTHEETLVTEIEDSSNFVEEVVERRPSERTLAWVKSLKTTVTQPVQHGPRNMDNSENVDIEDAPPSYDICVQQQQQQQPESIYELQMDETLETISGDKSFRNTFTSEELEDAISTLREGEESTSIAEGQSDGEQEEEQELEEEEEEDEEPVEPLLTKETEKQSIRRPTCLRRPDGASNPNLCAAASQKEEEQPRPAAIQRGVSITDSDSGTEFRNVPIVAAVAVKGNRPEVVSSSGYESMLRGSGDTGSCESSSTSSGSSDCGDRKNKQKAMEPLEIQEYCAEDVERMGRRRREEEMRAACKRRLKVRELLCRQERLKGDLDHAKRLLMVSPSSWSFDLHVAEQMEQDNPHYLEALEKETQILEKRVEAAKSRIMLVTCFDSFNV